MSDATTRQGAGFRGFIRNRFFLGGLLAASFLYTLFLCFQANPLLEESTASEIGMRKPALFLIFLLLIGPTFFFNLWNLYETYQCPKWLDRLGRALACLGVCVLPVLFLVNGKIVDGERVYYGISMQVHWACSITYIACSFACAGFLFLHARRQVPRLNIFVVTIIVTVAAMLSVIIFVGKSGLFEAIPCWIQYIVLFLVNCTNLFAPPQKKPRVYYFSHFGRGKKSNTTAK